VLSGTVPWPEQDADRYRREGYWSERTLAELLRAPARSDPARVALVIGDEQVTYARLDELADRRAAGLRLRGIGGGDRIVVQLPNCLELVILCIALFRVGAIPILALSAHRRAEIGYLCGHAQASGLAIPDTHGGFDYRVLAREVREGAPGLRHVLVAGDPAEFTALDQVTAEPIELPTPDPGEVALFLLSGGTTGLPKLIPRTHQDYGYQLRVTAETMGAGAPITYLAALPMAHNAALGCPGVIGTLLAGGRVVLAGSPAPEEIFPLIAREQVTLTTLMPALVKLWAATVDLFDVDLSGLVIEVGGARLEPGDALAAEQALGATLTRWFGMGEGPLYFTRPDDPPSVRLSTEGRAMGPADELRIVDAQGHDVPAGEVGELLARGPHTLRGYYRAEDYNARTFTPDGFLRTGDLARMTPAGDLVVEGRIRDVINRGGEKVSTGEVEDHLREHPDVGEVALVAVPDRSLGEKSCAVVIPVAGAGPSLAQLCAHLLERGLAEYKLPDQLEVVERFPYTGVGKVDKRALSAGLASPGMVTGGYGWPGTGGTGGTGGTDGTGPQTRPGNRAATGT
jgi:2,3-dihydroxybenzoate-AMP ligase